jgi:hypothetical protein
MEMISFTPKPLYPPGKQPAGTGRKAGWAPEPVWTLEEKNLVPAGIRTLVVQTVSRRSTERAMQAHDNSVPTTQKTLRLYYKEQTIMWFRKWWWFVLKIVWNQYVHPAGKVQKFFFTLKQVVHTSDLTLNYVSVHRSEHVPVSILCARNTACQIKREFNLFKKKSKQFHVQIPLSWLCELAEDIRLFKAFSFTLIEPIYVFLSLHM